MAYGRIVRVPGAFGNPTSGLGSRRSARTYGVVAEGGNAIGEKPKESSQSQSYGVVSELFPHGTPRVGLGPVISCPSCHDDRGYQLGLRRPGVG